MSKAIDLKVADRIAQRRDALKFLVTEKLKMPTMIAVSGLALAATGVAGFEIASYLSENPLAHGLGFLSAGAVGAYAVRAMNQLVKEIQSKVEPIKTGFNQLSNERIFKNFLDIEMHRAPAQMDELAKNIATNAKPERINTLLDYLKNDYSVDASNFAGKVKRSFDAKLTDAMQGASNANAKNVSAVNQSLTPRLLKLESLVQRCGIKDAVATAYQMASVEINTSPAPHNRISAAQLSKALVDAEGAKDTIGVDLVKSIRSTLTPEQFENFVDAVNQVSADASSNAKTLQANNNQAQTSDLSHTKGAALSM